MVGKAGLAADFTGLTLEGARSICPLLDPQATLPWPWWTSAVESREDLVARIDSAVEEHRSADNDLLIISHGGPMNAATKAWLTRSGQAMPAWLDCWNTQLNRFRRDANGNWHCEAIADTAHLDGDSKDLYTCNHLNYQAMQRMKMEAGG